MTSFRIAAAAAAVVLASTASAQDASKPVSRADFIKNLDGHFAQVDTNHDGFLSAAELATEQQRELQQGKAVLQQRARDQFQRLDTNKDGQLSVQEFMALVPTIRTAQTPQQALQALDSSHDGKISADEFRAPKLANFNKADANHDGIVTPAEMKAASGQK
jgi:Ca2+-binding EF-hand superfamily protein